MDGHRPSTADKCVQCERRGTPRHALGSLVAVGRGEVEDAARVEDIGVNGLRIHGCSGVPLVVGERVMLRFSLPQLAEPVLIEGSVRWVDRDHCGGIAFERGLRAREAWAIGRLPRLPDTG